MERLRPLTRRGRGPALLALLAGGAIAAVGCATATQFTAAVKQTVEEVIPADKPAPASQALCFWQRRLAPLPDPTRDGAQTVGLPGQLFLLTPDNRPAEADGDLAVVVYDETPRKGGAPMRPEVWHYTKETLARLVTNDERFGRSFVLFLPWPADWKDVTAVKILARYQSPGSPDLYASEVRVALDTGSSGGPVWSEVGPGGTPSGGRPPGSLDTRSVPNPTRMLEEARAAAAAGPAGVPAAPTVSPAGGFPQLPPPTLQPAAGR